MLSNGALIMLEQRDKRWNFKFQSSGHLMNLPSTAVSISIFHVQHWLAGNFSVQAAFCRGWLTDWAPLLNCFLLLATTHIILEPLAKENSQAKTEHVAQVPTWRCLRGCVSSAGILSLL